MLGEHSLESSQALGGLNVADNTNDSHWWCLHNGDSLDGLLLIQLGAETVDLAHDMGHTSLVADERRQVHWLGRVVLGEGLAFASMSSRTLFGQEAERAVSGVFELSVTL